MTDLRKWSENAFVMLAGLKESVQWELAPAIMKEIRELVDAYPVGAAPSEGMKPGLPTVEQLAQRMAYQHPDMGPEERQRQWEKIPVDNPWRKQWLDTANLVLEFIQSALSPARSGEPSAPQTNAELEVCDQYGFGATPERAAPQPVSGDAPPKCPNEILRELMQELHYTLDMGGKLSLPTQIKMQQADIYLNKLAGDAPKVEEIARQIAEKLVAHHLSVWQGLEKAIELYMELIIPFLRPYFPPASQTPKNVIEAATELLDAMETCHICKGALILQEHPVHCEGCPSDCENHEGTECTPIYVLHAKLRKLLKLATPASTARTDGWPDLLYGDHEAWCGKYTRNGESNSGGNIGVWYASAVFWRNRAEGILNPSELPAAPGSVPQAPDSPNKPPCPNCGCNHFRGENTLCNDGVPQAEPPKEEKP